MTRPHEPTITVSALAGMAMLQLHILGVVEESNLPMQFGKKSSKKTLDVSPT